MLKGLTNKIRYRSRHKKFEQLLRYIMPKASDNFLEVGVANREHSPIDNFLIGKYPYRDRMTALGIGSLSIFEKNYPWVKAVTYDGRLFPFRDKQFDIAHSNAVLEHVGPFNRQELFLKEMVRVSRRGMITTPNRGFFIETHTRVPFVHWLGKKWFDPFVRMIGKGWAADDYMYLVSRDELVRMAENIELKSYRIFCNRFLGMSMTYSLIWFED